MDELQMVTDHARRESLLKYAAVQAEAKRTTTTRVVKPGDRTGTGKRQRMIEMIEKMAEVHGNRTHLRGV
ncbi:MAG TPA: hypothetical protein PLO63_05440 [Syntrophales bacterium]|jgi:hypothetical protein|nr:hypothetical protein [Syntrophales bacterium]